MSHTMTPSAGQVSMARTKSMGPEVRGSWSRRWRTAARRSLLDHGSRGMPSSGISALMVVTRSASTRTSQAMVRGSSGPSPMAADRGGIGIFQLRVFMASNAEPTTRIRSAAAMTSATSGSCGGASTISGWPAMTPRAAYVVTTGAPSASASADSARSPSAPHWTMPPPAQMTTRGESITIPARAATSDSVADRGAADGATVGMGGTGPLRTSEGMPT